MNLSAGLPRMLQADLVQFEEIWERGTFLQKWSSKPGFSSQEVACTWRNQQRELLGTQQEGNACSFTKEGCFA